MQDRHKEINADENDIKQLQLHTHTHKVQAKSTCKFGAHDKRLACLGVEEYPGEGYDQLSEKFAGERFYLKGDELEKGQNGHF